MLSARKSEGLKMKDIIQYTCLGLRVITRPICPKGGVVHRYTFKPILTSVMKTWCPF